MKIAQFNESNKIGKIAEEHFIQYLNKRNLNYIDVRYDKEYQSKDIDFIVDNTTYEVKYNYHNAIYGRPGWFFWIELQVDKISGWWYKCKADYYVFLNHEGCGIIIENNQLFKNIIHDAIESKNSFNNQIDTVYDRRYSKIIDVLIMRYYIEDLNNSGVNFQRLVKRYKI